MNQRKFLQINTLQDLLTIGYLYLLVLGLLKDVIFYSLVGINIISYVGIVDILLSPLQDLFHNEKMVLAIFVISLGLFIFSKFYAQKYSEKLAKAEKEGKSIVDFNKIISFAALGLFSFFIGIGLGKGIGKKKDIEQQSYSLNYHLVYNDQQEADVFLVGRNSQYLFYVTEGDSVVSASPITGIIKQMKKINTEKE